MMIHTVWIRKVLQNFFVYFILQRFEVQCCQLGELRRKRHMYTSIVPTPNKFDSKLARICFWVLSSSMRTL